MYGFSFRLPEEDPVCECKYDEAHDRRNREDCPFHCGESMTNSQTQKLTDSPNGFGTEQGTTYSTK